MESQHFKYRQLAEDAIREVYEKDYYGLLALPFPKISFLSPEEENFYSGEYFIKVGKDWQIHLNFGKFSDNYKDFKEEVRVLTRHEIEHYQTCPFDVIGQFRIIKAILDTNKNHTSPLSDNVISKIAGSIANQIADVIVDTKNYFKYTTETLKSEREWIKKGCGDSFQSASRNGKLMFLLKEAIWNEDLYLYETDSSLIQTVERLASECMKEGIENNSLFIVKTKEYTDAFLRMVELDQRDYEEQMSLNLGNQSDQVNEQNTQYQNSASPIPSKDDNDGTGQLVYQNEESVENAVNQLAQETSIDEFHTILDIAGIDFKNEKEKKKIWFEQNNIDAIPIITQKFNSIENDISFPTIWKIGDSIEELDLLLSFQSSPKLMPGITTKKWEKQYNPIPLDNSGNSDLFLIIDTSGSMGDDIVTGSRLHEAVLASFGFIKFFEEKKGKIALVNFSSTPIICDWTDDYEKIKDTLLIKQGSSTNFPKNSIEKLTIHKREGSVIVIITDGEISNWQEIYTLFTDLLNLNNDLFLFLMDNKEAINKYSELRNYGGIVEFAKTVNDIQDTVFDHIKMYH